MLQAFLDKYQQKPVQEHANSVLSSIPAPKVSVWLVTYNQIRYITQAIDSVLMQQTNFDFEIILGDDDSNDGTRELCISYANRYPEKIRLFLHHRANATPIAGDIPNPNFQGVYNWYQCRGEYIATLEGDDFWTDPFKLQKQVDFLDTHAGYTGVCTNFAVCNQNGVITKPVKYERILYPDFALPYKLKFHTISRTLVCMYRNLEVVKLELPHLAHAPFLDKIILVLMSQRGPIRCLEDNTATFRAGVGYFSPQRSKIGLVQRQAQWQILADHFQGSPWINLALAELHAIRVNKVLKGRWITAVRVWIKNLIPITRDKHFSWKWYLRLRILGELRVPMSWYACNPQKLSTLSGSIIAYKKDLPEMVQQARKRLESGREEVIEVTVAKHSLNLLSAWKWLPVAYFDLGLRYIGFKKSGKNTTTLVFVREGSTAEKGLWTSASG